jgi:hypothetical protein
MVERLLVSEILKVSLLFYFCLVIISIFLNYNNKIYHWSKLKMNREVEMLL